MHHEAEKDLADKIKRCVAARELAKKHYTKHRDLLEQIANEIEPGREVQLGDGMKATLIDQFADKMTVFRLGGEAWPLDNDLGNCIWRDRLALIGKPWWKSVT